VKLAPSPLDDFTWKVSPYQIKKPLPPEIREALGRRMFYDAKDYVLSDGLACAGCHPDGRDDGHVYQEIAHGQLAEGLSASSDYSLAGAPIRGPSGGRGVMAIYRGHPRQTPMLAGRVDAAGPYGWHGESSTLEKRIEAGFQIHRWSGSSNAVTQTEDAGFGESALRASAIAAFLRRGLVPPPGEVHEATAEEEHGRKLFFLQSTGCASCHEPAGGYTDRIPVALGKADDIPGVAEEPESRLFKTPSLHFVGGTPPYFHDGRAPTLEALLDDNHDRMGHTDQLSRRDRAALVAFLRTL
jgi:cytochrome c peroxidase